MSDKTITIDNFTMESYIDILKNFLYRRDIIGYAAARNIRRLTEASYDHATIKANLLKEYGTLVKDDEGNDTDQIVIYTDNENYDLVKKELDISGYTEHDVNIFMITYEDVINELTGNEILSIDWMIQES